MKTVLCVVALCYASFVIGHLVGYSKAMDEVAAHSRIRANISIVCPPDTQCIEHNSGVAVQVNQ